MGAGRVDTSAANLDEARVRAKFAMMDTDFPAMAALGKDVLALADRVEQAERERDETDEFYNDLRVRAAAAEARVAALEEALREISEMPVRIQPGSKLAENPQITQSIARAALGVVGEQE